jgi:hypothetical protein
MKSPLLALLLLGFVPACFASSVSITTTSLPNGTADTAYSAVIDASGGCTPYSWDLTSGQLPAGVTMKPAATSLSLAGTPTTAATYSFTVAVTACGKHDSQMSYKVVIQPTANHVVDLHWSAPSANDLAGYNVYRGPSATSLSKINSGVVPSTLYDDSSVSNGSTYYYAVTAVDIYGNESAKSSTIETTVP